MIFNPIYTSQTPPVDPVFANNTWEQIIEACHNNEVPDTWVADGTCYKDMDIGGTPYRIDIIGKNHDDLSDGTGKAPLTFQMHDCYNEFENINSSGTNGTGWTKCAMRSTKLPAILALMPAEVQAGIREVQKKTSAGKQSTSIQTTNDKLFLLSEIEVFGTTTHSYVGEEGTQYAYYKAGNSKVKNRSGSAQSWWERSPCFRSSTSFCDVDNWGSASYGPASTARGFAFGFCF